MPNTHPRVKFVPGDWRDLSTETPEEERYRDDCNFLGSFERPGWLRLDINLRAPLARKTPAPLVRKVATKITEAIDDFKRAERALEDQEILKRRAAKRNGKLPSAVQIARRLGLPLDRVKDVIYRRKSVPNA